ncbi:MAG: hypothetical protein B7Y51_04350 [Burkholderiales bacterium 28-67-8]|nr:MAG: hypothetical protein B7Y51_04350 [Burkholderiales bacterium 28-67-8]
MSGRAVPSSAERSNLGPYRIEHQLGRGAMGAVYLATDPRTGKAVALKTMVLDTEFGGAELEDARQRFFREAETAGRLRHPDIVRILDAGEQDGTAYVAMEYLTGHDLQRHAQTSQLLSVPVVLQIGIRVADALAYAHSHGVVHRDVKPANVMVDPDAGVVKVTDFGIACVADASRTRTGVVLGTPSFMSPEQLSGRRVDGRSDLYSLGVMLFQLLTGQLPHQNESMARLLHAIVNEPAADIRSVRPELPEPLALAVARLLSKQPEARPADGWQVANELRAIAAQALPDASLRCAPVVTNPAALQDLDAQPFATTVILPHPDRAHNPDR